MDIRKAALVACIFSVLNLLISMWNVAHKTAALESPFPQWLMVTVYVAAILFDAILPVFYFALYRDKGTLLLARELRLVALTAALMLGASLAVELPQWIGSLGRFGTSSVLVPERRPWTASDLSGALAMSSNAACMFLMFTLYRQKRDEEEAERAPISRLLRVTSLSAVIGWGACIAFSLVRLVVSPHTYATLRDAALDRGRMMPPFRDMLVEDLLLLLLQAGLFAGPYVIWRANSRSGGSSIGFSVEGATNPLSR